MAGERDSAATRAAILDAARAEFGAHGFAGARIDRIAAASGRNRALIYAYFTSKEVLFETVFDAMVGAVTSQVPIDADDLPAYAVQLFDEMHRDPRPVRLAVWDRLERNAAGLQAEAVRRSNDAKVAAIADAQRRGVVSDRIPADELLDVIVALSRLHGRGPDDEDSRAAVDRRREAVRAAVAAIVEVP